MHWMSVALFISIAAAPAWGAPLSGDELCGLLYAGLTPSTFPYPTGIPEDLVSRIDMETFLTDAHDIGKVMAHQIAGEDRGARDRGLTIKPPALFNARQHYYMTAITNLAVNHTMKPMLAAQGYSTEHLAPSKRLVLVIHQWSGNSGNKDLQKATAEFIDQKANKDPVVLLASPTFPITNPTLLQQAKRGGILFSKEGTVVHKDEEGNIFQRDLKIDTDELVIVGGFCDDCMKRGAQGAIQLALENPDRKTLTVRLPPNLIYQPGLFTLGEELAAAKNHLADSLIAVAAKQLPTGHWDLPSNWIEAKPEIARTRKLTFYQRGTGRQITFDFND